MPLISVAEYDRRVEAELRSAAGLPCATDKKVHLDQAAELAWLSELTRRHHRVVGDEAGWWRD